MVHAWWYSGAFQPCCTGCSLQHLPWPMLKYRRTRCMATMLTWLQSSGSLRVRTSENTCDCTSCWYWSGTSPSHCGCLSDYPRLPWEIWNLMRRVGACTEFHGGHFECLIWTTPWAITHKLNASGHMLTMWNSRPDLYSSFSFSLCLIRTLDVPWKPETSQCSQIFSFNFTILIVCHIFNSCRRKRSD
jgi:hypothetical protein